MHASARNGTALGDRRDQYDDANLPFYACLPSINRQIRRECSGLTGFADAFGVCGVFLESGHKKIGLPREMPQQKALFVCPLEQESCIRESRYCSLCSTPVSFILETLFISKRFLIFIFLCTEHSFALMENTIGS